jgi:hypothetical protein
MAQQGLYHIPPQVLRSAELPSLFVHLNIMIGRNTRRNEYKHVDCCMILGLRDQTQMVWV